jgi:hypothetical protein
MTRFMRERVSRITSTPEVSKPVQNLQLYPRYVRYQARPEDEKSEIANVRFDWTYPNKILRDTTRGPVVRRNHEMGGTCGVDDQRLAWKRGQPIT